MYHGIDRSICSGGRSLTKGDRVDEATTLALARRLCPELPFLVPAADMDRLAGELTGLIQRGEAGEPVGTEILGLLHGYPTLRHRANELEAPEVRRSVLARPPGDIALPLGPRYVCPNGDFEYFLRDVSQPVPACPHDGADLVPGNRV
jgi:hypothetical protein